MSLPQTLYGAPRHSSLLEKKLAKNRQRFSASRTGTSHRSFLTTWSRKPPTPTTHASVVNRRVKYDRKWDAEIFHGGTVNATYEDTFKDIHNQPG
jgi:hypothetical protein